MTNIASKGGGGSCLKARDFAPSPTYTVTQEGNLENSKSNNVTINQTTYSVWDSETQLVLELKLQLETSCNRNQERAEKSIFKSLFKAFLSQSGFKYTINSEPKVLTGDKSEGIKNRGAAEAFIRGFIPS